MNIGICGGTFDPFHNGHLAPVLAVRNELRWDFVLYLPAFVQPFKQDRETTAPYHRFAMTAMATLRYDFLIASELELNRGVVSYTVDTLTAMRGSSLKNHTLDWIIGDDNLPALGQWKSIDRIFELANFVVLTRGAHQVPAEMRHRVTEAGTRPKNGAIVLAHNPTVPVSSTEIRRRVGAGESIEGLVPSPVSRYIQHYHLYRKVSS